MYQFKNGRKFFLQFDQGIVLGAESSQHTAISQTSSSVYPRTNGGVDIVPGRIHSYSIDISKVWLRLTTGKERQFNISSFAVPVREGHELAIVYGGPEGAETVYPFGAFNKTTGQMLFRDEDYYTQKVVKEWHLGPPRGIGWKLLLPSLLGVSALLALWNPNYLTLLRTQREFCLFVVGGLTLPVWFLAYGIYGDVSQARWSKSLRLAIERAARSEFEKL